MSVTWERRCCKPSESAGVTITVSFFCVFPSVSRKRETARGLLCFFPILKVEFNFVEELVGVSKQSSHRSLVPDLCDQLPLLLPTTYYLQNSLDKEYQFNWGNQVPNSDTESFTIMVLTCKSNRARNKNKDVCAQMSLFSVRNKNRTIRFFPHFNT